MNLNKCEIRGPTKQESHQMEGIHVMTLGTKGRIYPLISQGRYRRNVSFVVEKPWKAISFHRKTTKLHETVDTRYTKSIVDNYNSPPLRHYR